MITRPASRRTAVGALVSRFSWGWISSGSGTAGSQKPGEPRIVIGMASCSWRRLILWCVYFYTVIVIFGSRPEQAVSSGPIAINHPDSRRTADGASVAHIFAGWMSDTSREGPVNKAHYRNDMRTKDESRPHRGSRRFPVQDTAYPPTACCRVHATRDGHCSGAPPQRSWRCCDGVTWPLICSPAPVCRTPRGS
jgi:hypothetical protein